MLVEKNNGLGEEVERLNGNLTAAKSEIDGFKRNLNDLGFQLKIKDGDIERLNSQLEEKQNEMNRLNASISELKGNVSNTTDRCKTSDAENARLKEELSKNKNAVINTRDSCKKHENTIWQLSQNIENKDSEIQDLKSLLKLANEKLNVLNQKTLPELKNLNMGLSKDKINLTAEVDEFLNQLKSVTDDLAKMKAANAKLEESVTNGVTDIKGQKEKILALNNEIDRLKKKNESDAQAAASKKAKLAEDVSLKAETIEELEKKEVMNNARIKNLENELAGRSKASASEVEDFKRKLEDALKDLAKAKELNDKSRVEATKFQKEITEKDQTIENLKLENKKIPGLNSNVKDLGAELEALRKQLEVVNSRSSDLENEIAGDKETITDLGRQ